MECDTVAAEYHVPADHNIDAPCREFLKSHSVRLAEPQVDTRALDPKDKKQA
jgi:hypothetical protein